MRTLYLDCFAGIAGDMFIGALLNLVPNPEVLREGIKKISDLNPSEYELVIEHTTRNGIAGINFDVHTHHDHHEHQEHDDEHAHHHEYADTQELHTHNHEHTHAFIHTHEHINPQEPGIYEHADTQELYTHNHEHTHTFTHTHEHAHISSQEPCMHTHENEHAHEHVHRNLADIEAMIMTSGLNERVKRETLRAFSILAEAEAHVHNTTPDKIHFHEVGAVDSIIDIAGAFILMDALNWPRVLCSSINVGSGTVKCAHGILPVPAPAAEYLLHGLPVFSSGSPMERTTPTGALLVKILADGFCTVPAGKILASGFGLGNRESNDMPNALRALLIDTGGEVDGLISEKVSLCECNIDDMNPQDYEILAEKLFDAGALDVWTENIYMKKSRPGVKFCCLSKPEDSMKLNAIILKNSTTQGVRIKEYDRLRLNWKIENIDTSLGKIRVKVTELNGEILRKVPEYEDLKAIAVKHNVSMWEIRKMIMSEM